jgi:hypothetical protein
MKSKYSHLFLENFFRGLFWAIGATLGFALFLTLLGIILNWLGGLPLVGNFFATIIELTNEALELRKTLPR